MPGLSPSDMPSDADTGPQVARLPRALERPYPSQAAAWMLVAGLAAVLLLPLVTRRGIFLDGLVYATISRNMAIGRGDFWHPVYVGAIAQFRDHPPLAFWLESFAFRLCGDHWWVEKLYSVGTALLTAGVIVATWRRLTRGYLELQACGWLPVALWMAIPCWQWTVANNLLENTLAVFTAASVYASLRAAAGCRWWPVWSVAAGACIVAAVLTKGPVGLFPLIAPAAAGICWREGAGVRNWVRRAAWQQMLLVAVVAAGIALLLCQHDCYDYLRQYWHKQVLASLKGQRETHPSVIGRAHILWEVFLNLVPGLLLAGVANRWARRRPAPTTGTEVPRPSRASRAARPQAGRESGRAAASALQPGALFCLLLGLAASCPVAISPKQTNFYVTPSYPFYVLAITLACGPSLLLLSQAVAPATLAMARRRLQLAAAGVLLIVLAACAVLWGKPRRDLREIEVASTVSRFVPPDTSIDVTPEVSREWALLGYLDRNHRIRMERDNAQREFRLEVRGSAAPPAGYEVVDVPMPRYRLLRKVGSGSDAASLARKPR